MIKRQNLQNCFNALQQWPQNKTKHLVASHQKANSIECAVSNTIRIIRLPIQCYNYLRCLLINFCQPSECMFNIVGVKFTFSQLTIADQKSFIIKYFVYSLASLLLLKLSF